MYGTPVLLPHAGFTDWQLAPMMELRTNCSI